MLSSAVPREPPTCWVVFSRAEATPASCEPTPTSAVDEDGMNTPAMPKLISSSDGITWVR